MSVEVYAEEAWKPSLYVTVLKVDQWHTIEFTQVVSLDSCDLFLFILVTRMTYLNYCKIVEENFDYVSQDILERT